MCRLYVPTMLVIGLHGWILPPVGILLCDLIVYSGNNSLCDWPTNIWMIRYSDKLYSVIGHSYQLSSVIGYLYQLYSVIDYSDKLSFVIGYSDKLSFVIGYSDNFLL